MIFISLHEDHRSLVDKQMMYKGGLGGEKEILCGEQIVDWKTT